MKGTILTTAILAMAILTIASSRSTLAYCDNPQIRSGDIAVARLSKPQTGSLIESQAKRG